MPVAESIEHFVNAKKLGMKEYSRNVSNGQTGYLSDKYRIRLFSALLYQRITESVQYPWNIRTSWFSRRISCLLFSTLSGIQAAGLFFPENGWYIQQYLWKWERAADSYRCKCCICHDAECHAETPHESWFSASPGGDLQGHLWFLDWFKLCLEEKKNG